MIAQRFISAVLGLALVASAPSALASEGSGEFPLPADDAVIRRTDSLASGAIAPSQVLPDLVNISIQRWLPDSPSTDPYVGSVVGGSNASIFRLQLTFQGLVNPPGTLGLNGQAFDPFKFGPSPVHGFFELDIDDESDTGGESSSTAALYTLGQASRFGGQFHGSIGERQARSAADLNQPWYAQPEVSLTGADFLLTLCGCYQTSVVAKSDPNQSIFGIGQTWVVRSRFFQRSAGYSPASLMTGGTSLGAYDPDVNVQFSHDPLTDRTTITYVGALTQAGAAALAGEPLQPADTSASNHISIQEAALDLIASSTRPGLTGLTRELIRRWSDADPSDALNPRRWNIRALVGTSYAQAEDGLYVWTDIGPHFTRADLNGDGLRSAIDRNSIHAQILALDGGPDDADATVNGSVVIPFFGAGFNIADVNGDGIINAADLDGIPLCPADFNASGTVTIQDVFDFLVAWFAGDADVNTSGSTTIQDVFDFLTMWFAGCP